MLNIYSERLLEFNNRPPVTSTSVATYWASLGANANEYIKATHETFLRRPELFTDEAAVNLMYALNVGDTSKNLETFLMRWQVKDEAIYRWAEVLMKTKLSMTFEPVMDKLNRVLAIWKGNGESVEDMRPMLGDSTDVTPYIAYLITYYVYGHPFQYSDEYSDSSMKSYLSSLDSWFEACYLALYKEHDVTELNKTEVIISDEVWRGFFDQMLNSRKIIELRNDEMNRTSDLLSHQTGMQLAIQDKELYEKFTDVLSRMIEEAVRQSPWMPYYRMFENDILNDFFDLDDLVKVTEWLMTGARENFAIDVHGGKWEYLFYRGSRATAGGTAGGSSAGLADTPAARLDTMPAMSMISGINCPYLSSDVVTRMFMSYLEKRILNKKSRLIDENPLKVEAGGMNDEIYDDVHYFTCSGIARLLGGYEKNEKTEGCRYVLRKLFGQTPGSILAPTLIEILDKLPGYEKPGIIAAHLTNLMYAFMYMRRGEYAEVVEESFSTFMEIIQTTTGIYQLYIKTMDDDTAAWALAGVDAYKFSTSPNPIYRGYGFVSHVFGVSDTMYLAYRLTEKIDDKTALDLIINNRDNWGTIDSALRLMMKYDDDLRLVSGKTLDEIMALIQNDILLLIDYSFRQSLPTMVLDNELLMVKQLGSESPAEVGLMRYEGRPFPVSMHKYGTSVTLPMYTYGKGSMTVVGVNATIPDGLRVERLPPFWILTDVSQESQFQRREPRFKLPPYMISERIPAPAKW